MMWQMMTDETYFPTTKTPETISIFRMVFAPLRSILTICTGRAMRVTGERETKVVLLEIVFGIGFDFDQLLLVCINNIERTGT